VLEAVELGHNVSEHTYDVELPKLRTQLLRAHFALRGQPFPVIVIVAGADAAGKGDVVHKFNEWLEPRGVETHAFWQPTDEERERPSYWRYWRAMPARGRIGIFVGAWYADPLAARVYGGVKRSKFDAAIDRVVAFEQMLVDDGALVVKLWLHLPKREQKKRLKKLEADGRLAPDDWRHYRAYAKFTKNAERALRRSDTAAAPWHVIEATDRRYRDLTAGEVLLKCLESRLAPTARPAKKTMRSAAPAVATPDPEKRESVLAHVDLTQSLAKPEYQEELDALQGTLSRLAWKALEKKRSTVMVFEGWDAGGKGSAIRRVTQAVDPRLYRVIGTAAPTDEERAHHYLWRFWRQLPRAGFMAVFDRSWYGRVLVERVEGFARPDEWARAFHEINEFEEQLAEHGTLLLKFWMHISPDEQLRRFKAREKVAYKRYKITKEDWRNRAKWPAYQHAVDDMVTKCSTEFAPWTIVAGNDKRFARIQVLRTVVERLEAVV
jgi:polyphosphate:AMP phosphotransferase